MADAAPSIKLDAVSMRYGDLLAVDSASVVIEPGEIHAIIGENGAGKSTLLKIASGSIVPVRGSVAIGGAPLVPHTQGEAVRRGVGMVHQHFMLVGAFRAIENVILGTEPLRGAFLDEAAAIARAKEIAQRARLEVPLDALTSELGVGERQRLEILRVLYRGARTILLDEPTAVLSPLESDELYATLARLAKEGNAIAVVTHRLDEVARFAQRVTVMRKGSVVLTRALEGAKQIEDELTRAIMGGDPPPGVALPSVSGDARAALSIRGLTLDDGGRSLLDRLDVEVRAGEIVGVAGVEGNGQRELVRAIAGLEPRATGSIHAGKSDLGALGVRDRRAYVSVVHEDRHEDGLCLDASVGDNLVLGHLGGGEIAMVARRIAAGGIVPPDPTLPARALSGGNQQKIVVARALDRTDTPLRTAVVLSQPTRGVDVGAAAAIRAAIVEAAEAGLGVLVISADLGELKRIAHRLVVIRRGAIVASLPKDATNEAIGRAMLGLEAA